MIEQVKYYATGRRKNASARVFLVPGDGNITINKQTLEKYFTRPSHRILIKRPLVLTEMLSRFNVKATIAGGGTSGQAGALSHGIARALLKADETLRPTLKKNGLLTRDPRMKERKKYGKRRARRSHQFSKR